MKKALIVVTILLVVGCASDQPPKNYIKSVGRDMAELGVSCGIIVALKCAGEAVKTGDKSCADSDRLKEKGMACVKGYVPLFFTEGGPK